MVDFDDDLGSLASNVVVVLARHLPDAASLVADLCREQGIELKTITSAEIETLLPRLIDAVTRVAGSESASDVRSDLRMLLDTDRFRREAVDPTERSVLLLVEDDDDVRNIVADLLREEGYHVEVAQNGKEAWERLEAGLNPSLVILDLMMPVMNGWGLWDRMQASPKHAQTPVVVVTASGLGPGSFGKTLVMRKPVDRTVLLGAVAVSVRNAAR